jgi:hypothetical protein
MKRLLTALALLPALAFAGPSDIVTNQRNATDTSSIPRTVAKPPGTQNGIMGYRGDPVDPRPAHWTIGAGLAIASDALVALPQSWSTITDKPATFAPSAHTHAAADIVSGTLALARLPALPISQTTGLQTALDGKFPTPTGTTAQYLRGDGSLAPFPALNAGTVTSITAGTGLSGGTITTSGTISLPNTGTAGSYANVTTDAQGRVTAGTNRSQAAATRALNAAFQVSATRDAEVRYTVQITVTASIAGGQNGEVVLEIASDSGFTTNVQTLGIAGLGQTYTLAIALQGVQPQTQQVVGYVPAGYYARLRTVNVTGTPAFAYRAGQEVLQ